MAFDQTALVQLLTQLGAGGLPNPAPSANIPLIPYQQPNVPEYGGPSTAVEPPVAPFDNRIPQQFMAASGPAPTPPAQPTRAQRIANVLMGVSEGLAGRGGEFISRLQEPQRRFEQQTADYNANKQRLAVTGLEAGMRDVERRTTRAQDMADRQHQEEFVRETRRLNLYDEAQQEKVRQAFELEKEARHQRFEVTKEAERRRLQQEDDARGIAGKLGSGPGAAPAAIAKELGEYYANIRQTVSPAAAKWQNAQARRAELLARGPVGSGAVSRRETLDLQRRMSQAATGIAGMEKLARQAMEKPEAERPPILGQMRAMAQTLQAQFPELIETGEHNNWPYARLKLRGSQTPAQPQGQPQAQAKIITRAEMAALGITEAQAKGEGYTITQ
jgi:hypothetical protein